jgi:glycosyltransferase involved in cell wall biosynthesis
MKEQLNLVTGISVIMPTFNQCCFISRSIESLILQTFRDWELIIINDGCTDNTEEVLERYLTDPRIHYLKNEENTGLGNSLNIGIHAAKFDFIAYLPSDDIYFARHLETLHRKLSESTSYVLAYAGVEYNNIDGGTRNFKLSTTGTIENYFQLVQVLQRKTLDRWLETNELITDDLGKMLWDRLLLQGNVVPTMEVTCEWVSHDDQRHMKIRENMSGGINAYKQTYTVKGPIRFQSTVGHYIDEVELYKEFRKPKSKAKNGLKILLLGELAYNAERICALEEFGHQLYGLWTYTPGFINTVGPLPFGNVEDIPLDNWIEKVKEIKPDIIYALLNSNAVPIVYHVMVTGLDIPLVWHFKEGPSYCRNMGIWNELIEIYRHSDGQIYINQEMKDWFSQFLQLEGPSLILDGDLPKSEYFKEERAPLLSENDTDIHTVVPGRPFGIEPYHVRIMADQGIHFHYYGGNTSAIYKSWLTEAERLASGYIHVHPLCEAKDWTKELSKYDAGWLHCFDSHNYGELIKATWDDLNYPARISTLAAAGLPMLQKNNASHIVATQNLTAKLGVGVFFNEFEELGTILRNKIRMMQIRENIWKQRRIFSFDSHVKDLTNFFYEVIAKYKMKIRKSS